MHFLFRCSPNPDDEQLPEVPADILAQAQAKQGFDQFAGQFGMGQVMNVQDLMYEDPDRADVAEWLDSHGWTSTSVTSQEEMRRLNRWVQVDTTDDKAFSTFVTAHKG